MRHDALLTSLMALTGDLSPGPQTSAAELTDLRRAYLRSLTPGGGEGLKVPAAQIAPSPALLHDLNYLIAQHVTTREQPVAPLQIVRRESPLRLALDPSLRDWPAAIAPVQTFGPFLDAHQRQVWFDVFATPPVVSVRRSLTQKDLLLLPAHTVQSPGDRRHFSIGAGSLWINAHALSAQAPQGAYAGVRIKSGTLTLNGDASRSGDVLIVPPNITITLTVILDPPSSPAPANLDADAALPGKVTFVFGAGGIDSVTTTSASLSLHGNEYSLTRNQQPPAYDPFLKLIIVPLQPSSDAFEVQEHQSSLFELSGAARLTRAGWAMPVTTTSPPQGEAVNTGYLLLAAGRELQATWQGLNGGPVTLPATTLLADPVSLLIMAEKAGGVRGKHKVELWSDARGKRSAVEFSFSNGFALSLMTSSAGLEVVFATATATPHLDRPLAASGKRIDTPLPVSYFLVKSDAGTTLNAVPQLPSPNTRSKRMALALSNGLVTTTQPLQFSLAGPLTTPNQMESGVLNVFFGVFQILPMLPDPYAANFGAKIRDAPAGNTQVYARVTWPDVQHPELALGLAPEDMGTTTSLAPAPVNFASRGDVTESFARGGLALLDVSSNADQLGVNIDVSLFGNAPPLTIRGRSLWASGMNACVFLLPQFQWEPVRNLPNNKTGDHDGLLFNTRDGGPTLMRGDSVRLVPVDPVPVAIELVRSYNDAPGLAGLVFTLPFGKLARAFLNRFDRTYSAPPALDILQPRLTGVTGAREIRLRAGIPRLAAPLKILFGSGTLLAGRVEQTDGMIFPPDFPPPLPPPPIPPPSKSVLGILKDSFNSRFRDHVPLVGMDFSGYGANIFSRWVIDAKPPDIGQVTFDAFHGRTSFERVQMVSILWPCQATMVRTITLERYGSGTVKRFDSGWLPTTPGLFRRDDTKVKFHTGVVHGMYNIREVTDTGILIPLAGALVEAVYFDADVEVEGVQEGSSGGRVPVRRQLGFVQLILNESKLPVKKPAPLTPAQMDELLQKQPRIGGPIDCVIHVGKSPVRQRATQIYADRALVPPGKTQPEFAVVADGALILSGPGQWSIAGVRDNSVTPLQGGAGVPLIRVNSNGGPSTPYRWADAGDMFAKSPTSDYALLFSSASQRMLYRRPKVDANDSNITSELKPLIADAYIMLHSKGLFPSISDAIEFKNYVPLSAAGGALTFVPPKIDFPSTRNTPVPLVSANEWSANASYATSGFSVDSGKGWDITIKEVKQRLSFPIVGNVMTLIHNVHSPVAANPSFDSPRVELSDAMKAVKEMFDLLRPLASGALGDPLKVTASFSGNTFHLLATGDFVVAGADGEPIDAGFGKVKGELQLGADLTADLPTAKIGGSVFLDITGTYEQLIFPFIYAGGSLRFRIAGDTSGQRSVALEACSVGSVGGDIIPYVASLEASVKYGYYIALVGGRFEPGFVLGMDGRAKLLDGLLGFKFSVEGRIIVTRVTVADPESKPPDNIRPPIPLPEVDFLGDILVAGTVTVAWALEESKSFHAQFSVKVDWRLVAADILLGGLPLAA